MKNYKILIWSAINSLAAALYVFAVSWVMFNGERLFGNMKGFFGPAALLLLFVFSATVEGVLVCGRPVYLYLGGKKEEAVKLFVYTVAFFGIITAGVLVFLALMK